MTRAFPRGVVFYDIPDDLIPRHSRRRGTTGLGIQLVGETRGKGAVIERWTLEQHSEARQSLRPSIQAEFDRPKVQDQLVLTRGCKRHRR